MRHKKAGKALSRNTSHRRAMLRNMVTSLFKYEQIETTDAKAKALRPVAEKMITLAKRGDLHARRQALAYMQDKAVTHRLFEELKARFTERQGGYLRIVKKDTRKGDGAPVSIVQFVTSEGMQKPGKKAKKAVKAKAAAKGAAKSKQGQAEEKKAAKTKAEDKKAADSGPAEASSEEDAADVQAETAGRGDEKAPGGDLATPDPEKAKDA
jgi:large subunit ribosomal protein L17